MKPKPVADFHLGLFDPFKAAVEAAIERLLPAATEEPVSLHQAMRYSMLGGGKRIRAILCMLAGEAFGVPAARASGVAAALEFLHGYSLIHDDLPCMDDSDLRRGRPTCHREFDEATALLAGDALLTLTFEVLASEGLRLELAPARIVAMVKVLGEAAGSRELIGGQMSDLEAEGREITLPDLEKIHRRKTGALIRASLHLGALVGEASDHERKILLEYGSCLGELFQITDDILDVISDTKTLGKPTAADLQKQKATYPRLIGLDASRKRADELGSRAARLLQDLEGRETTRLQELALFLPRRDR